jgi:hypothetical protein
MEGKGVAGGIILLSLLSSPTLSSSLMSVVKVSVSNPRPHILNLPLNLPDTPIKFARDHLFFVIPQQEESLTQIPINRRLSGGIITAIDQMIPSQQRWIPRRGGKLHLQRLEEIYIFS